MHNKDSHTCYLCMKLHGDYSPKRGLEEHHVLGGPNRKLSEKYGLKVYLCGIEHHREGKESVHKNADVSRMVKEDAQRAFERIYPNKDFRAIFGKNYIDHKEPNSMSKNAALNGFKFIE